MSNHIGSAERTSRMNKNIILSFVMKFLSVVINLIYVPLTINYINAERYGIWLTISSLISWMALLDIGFGNGLRNRYAEATEKGDPDAQSKLIQSTVWVLILISAVIILADILFNKYIRWSEVLGVPFSYQNELENVFFYLILLFAIQFIFQIITPVNYALQRSSYVSIMLLLGNIFGMTGVLLLKHFGHPSLLSLGLAVMGGNVLSQLLFFVYYFFIDRRDLFKVLQKPDLIILKSIFSLGIKFFVVNIAYVVQYQTSNFLIGRYFNFQAVTQFNVAFKLFSVVSIIFGILISPVWSTVTSAYLKNDFGWIENVIKKLLALWFGLCIIAGLMLLLSSQIYSIWIGPSVFVPFSISLGVALVVCSNCFTSIFIQILNGLSQINMQFWISLIVIICFVPFAYYLSVSLKLGVFGICLSIIITSLNGLIIAPIQLFRTISKMKSKSYASLIQ